MHNLFTPDVSVWERIIRAGAVYLFLLIAFRFSGKRQVGQLTPFDLVVLLVVSNIVQNAMIGNDNSILGGFIGVATVLALNWVFVEMSYRYKKARRMLEGEPVLLVHNGKVYHDRLERERLTEDDLLAAIRKSGLSDTLDVRVAMLEENGQISVIPREKTKA